MKARDEVEVSKKGGTASELKEPDSYKILKKMDVPNQKGSYILLVCRCLIKKKKFLLMLKYYH